MQTILHISTSHYHNDNRIYYKEIIGAAKAGYKVGFIVPAHASVTTPQAKIFRLQRSSNKFRKYIMNQFVGFYKILKIRPEIVHFHDPELLMIALLLSSVLRKTQFIYDVHEDNYTALRSRGKPGEYPRLKHLLARVVRWFELQAHSRIHLIVAERYYKRFFPKASEVLNYPVLVTQKPAGKDSISSYYELIYTGNITIERGLNIYKNLIKMNKNIRIHLVGRISESIARQTLQELGNDAERLVIPYIDKFVDPNVLQAYYGSHKWVAGLAVFPMSDHYYEKELTKLFEYMMNSIPVICSNFPTWENIILNHHAGISVDPANLRDISNHLNRLGENKILVSQLGANGYKALVENYRWLDQEKTLISVYEKILTSC